MEEVSAHALARMVTKFVYHKNLNSSYWVTVQSNVVKINKFKHEKKEKKTSTQLCQPQSLTVGKKSN